MRPRCEIASSFIAGPSALGSLRWDLRTALLVCSPQTGHFVVLSYLAMTGMGRALLRAVENLHWSLKNPVYRYRLVYLGTFFLLNNIDIRCSLIHSGGSGRCGTSSNQSLNIGHFMPRRTIHGKLLFRPARRSSFSFLVCS